MSDLIELGPLAGFTVAEILDVIALTDDPDDLDAIIAGLEAELAWTPWPYQEPPAGPWVVWLFLGGRFTGKTDTDAAWLDDHAKGPPCDPRLPGGHRMSIVGPTLGDVAESCVNGPSGLRAHNPAVRMVTRPGGTVVVWPNGAEAKLFGGWTLNDVERFRAGGNRCACWIEEAAAIPQLEGVIEQIPFGHRLGPNPQVVMSTTPKPRAALKQLVAFGRAWSESTSSALPSRWQRVALTRASSNMNPSIDPDVVAGLYDLFGGTRLGRQELEGELLDDYEGALWQREQLDADRIEATDLPVLVRRNVGVDPSTWGVKIGDRAPIEGELARGIETGIVVNGIAADRQIYTLGDFSKRCTPAEWADRTLDAYVRLHCSAVVFETNAGGAMGPAIIMAQEKLRRLERPGEDFPPVRFFRQSKGRIGVIASDGKRARAEPVAMLSEQHRHHMVGTFPLLEDQMCLPGGTLISCADGKRPLEEVGVGALVATRKGWRPVVVSGYTGVRPVLTVHHELGCVVCTPDHPLWVEGRGFVPAENVEPGDLLLVEPSSASGDRPSRGVAAGGTAWSPGTTATAGTVPATPRASSSTASSTRPTSGPSPLGGMSTTGTKTPATTVGATSSRSPRLGTSRSTRPAVSARGMRSGAALRSVAGGRDANLGSGPASSVAKRSSLGRPALVTAAVVARSGPSISVAVYDLTVADAHEFIADGVLVHNCTWDPNEAWSPDRIDGHVWGVTALSPWRAPSRSGMTSAARGSVSR